MSEDSPTNFFTSIGRFIDNHRIAICILLTMIALAFILYGHKYREQVQLALKKEFVKLPAVTVDWWSISHMALYAIFGLLVPDYHFTFFLLGCGFEVIEDCLSSDETTQLVDCVEAKKGGQESLLSNVMCGVSINDDYWYAKWDDVFMNLLGYTIGSGFRTTFIK